MVYSRKSVVFRTFFIVINIEMIEYLVLHMVLINPSFNINKMLVIILCIITFFLEHVVYLEH